MRDLDAERGEWFYTEHRIHPVFYQVSIQGKEEWIVEVRGGLSFPSTEDPGYFVLVGQMEKRDRDGNLRLIALLEDVADLNSRFFEKIALECTQHRIKSLVHGGKVHFIGGGHGIRQSRSDTDWSFGSDLEDFLNRNSSKYRYVEKPSVGPCIKSDQPDFLVTLLRDYLANRALIFFELREGRTPILINKVRSSSLETDLLKVPQFRALSYVVSDFHISPWRPPELVREGMSFLWRGI
jgi:hypothetical protein